ncbi:MAG: hypothetical protein AB1414_00620 [bacterium]
MKITYVLKGNPEWLPPVMNQIKILKELNHEIYLITSNISEAFRTYLEKNNIHFNLYRNKHKVKIINWICFRYFARRKIRKASFDLLIYGSLDTAIVLEDFKKKKNSILNIWELYDKYFFYESYMKIFLRKFPFLICPEYNRGFLLKHSYKLDKLPTVLPNKPDFFGEVDITSIQNVIEIVTNISNSHKIIIYQGQIYSDRNLETIALELKKLNSDRYFFVLLGIDHGGFVDKIKEIYQNTYYIGYIPAPLHLEITKYAHIGIVNYAENSLNNIYCAPNKIYEYGAFSKPMIGNNIPGLKYTIEHSNSGICVNYSIENEFIVALNNIESNYGFYSANSKRMYDNIDNKKELSKLIDSIHI